MARGHGRILTSIWEDHDFLALRETEQRMYLFLISQPNLNHAGLLDLTLRRWARKAAGLTVAELEKRITELEAARFIVVDDDTEELLIRSFVRRDGVWRMPKVMGAMVSGALEISSPRLQQALLAEMDRIPLDELSDEPTKARGVEGPSIREQVAVHIRSLRKAFGNPNPDPSRGGSGTPSATRSGTPSDTPSEGGRKPSTRADAGAPRAHSPSPSPTPTPVPSPVEDGSAQAGDECEVVVVEESDFVGADNTAAEEPEPITAGTVVGEWLERCTKRPPNAVVGRVAKQIKNLLGENIHPDDIRRGLARWMAKGADPSSIPSFVNEAMNASSHGNVIALASGQPLPGTDTTVSGWAALAASLATGDSA